MQFKDLLSQLNSKLTNMKLDSYIVCDSKNDLMNLLNSCSRYDKVYSFIDLKALITHDNVNEITAAINDLKLSIFQVKNTLEFNEENINEFSQLIDEQYKKWKVSNNNSNKFK